MIVSIMIIKQVQHVKQGTIFNINVYIKKSVEEDSQYQETKKSKEQPKQELDILEKFYEKKIENLRLEKAYIRLKDYRKAERIRQCSTYLEFMEYKSGKKKLLRANFCRERLCPECAWRRALKAYTENRQCMNEIVEKGRFIFLTVSCKNVKGLELTSEIEKYINGFKKLMNRKKIKSYVLGTMRALEVTYKQKDNTFHPHIHCLIHVTNDYFSRGYINQAEWAGMWAEEMYLEYTPEVHIKNFKFREKTQNMGRELAEISKYCVKFSSFMKLNDKLFNYAIEILDNALYRRRLIIYTGTFRAARKKLRIKNDIENDWKINEDFPEDDEGYKVLYYWHFKKGQYVKRLEESQEI